MNVFWQIIGRCNSTDITILRNINVYLITVLERELRFKESQGTIESPFHKMYSNNVMSQELKLYNQVEK